MCKADDRSEFCWKLLLCNFAVWQRVTCLRLATEAGELLHVPIRQTMRITAEQQRCETKAYSNCIVCHQPNY